MKNGGPAFPRQLVQVENRNDFEREELCEQSGMSLRDWFAGMAVSTQDPRDAYVILCRAAGLSDEKAWPAQRELAHRMVARNCYQIADAMLAHGVV